ncbi:hypothetical protein DRO54_08480, partial [Candidatus Bathyarchaeota archaeon]
MIRLWVGKGGTRDGLEGHAENPRMEKPRPGHSTKPIAKQEPNMMVGEFEHKKVTIEIDPNGEIWFKAEDKKAGPFDSLTDAKLGVVAKELGVSEKDVLLAKCKFREQMTPKVEYDNLGLVKGYKCPSCGSELKFSHQDDIGNVWLKCEKGHYARKPKKNPLLKSLLLEPVETDILVPDPDRYKDEKGRFCPELLAQEIMNDYRFITMMDNEQIYVYRDGFYQPIGEVIIKAECSKRLGPEYRKNRATEVIDYIKTKTYVKRREEPPNLIPLANGVLDLNTMELKPHSPGYMFLNKLPVNYNPNADCPNIKRFLREITATEEDVNILLEVIGFCLYRDYFIAKALMLVGGGANGKSTFLNLVKAFLGFENVSSRSLHDLEENRFAKADLHHKLANIYADLPDKALFRTGTFKMLTGKDPITAERKFQNSFQFVNYAKLLFSANKVPEAYDDTDAFFRRWIIVVFPNQFVGDRADPRILEKLTTEEELSGLLNLALKALKGLLERGEFSYSKTTEEIRQDYIRKSSPIAAFVMDCLEVDPDAMIVKKELYALFAAYCRMRNIPTVTQDTFFKNLPRHAVVGDSRPKIEGKRLTVFKGIRLSLAVSRVLAELSAKEANGSEMSTLSNVSRVFYSLIERKAEYEQLGYEVEVLTGESYIKIKVPLDRLDTLDISKENASLVKSGQLTFDTQQNKPKESSMAKACKQPTLTEENFR